MIRPLVTSRAVRRTFSSASSLLGVIDDHGEFAVVDYAFKSSGRTSAFSQAFVITSRAYPSE